MTVVQINIIHDNQHTIACMDLPHQLANHSLLVIYLPVDKRIKIYVHS